MDTEEIFIDIDSLPTALSEDELMRLFVLKGTGSNAVREKIIVHNIRLVGYIVRTRFSFTNFEVKELMSVGVIGLIRAVDSFDYTKGYKFSSYAGRCIENEILMYIRANKKHVSNLYLYDLLEVQDDNDAQIEVQDDNDAQIENKFVSDINIEDEYEAKENVDILNSIIDSLSENEQRLIRMYYGIGCKSVGQVELSRIFNVCQGAISRRLKKTTKKIRQQFND